jgi:hypothetical protein
VTRGELCRRCRALVEPAQVKRRTGETAAYSCREPYRITVHVALIDDRKDFCSVHFGEVKKKKLSTCRGAVARAVWSGRCSRYCCAALLVLC